MSQRITVRLPDDLAAWGQAQPETPTALTVAAWEALRAAREQDQAALERLAYPAQTVGVSRETEVDQGEPAQPVDTAVEIPGQLDLDTAEVLRADLATTARVEPTPEIIAAWVHEHIAPGIELAPWQTQAVIDTLGGTVINVPRSNGRRLVERIVDGLREQIAAIEARPVGAMNPLMPGRALADTSSAIDPIDEVC